VVKEHNTDQEHALLHRLHTMERHVLVLHVGYRFVRHETVLVSIWYEFETFDKASEEITNTYKQPELSYLKDPAHVCEYVVRA